MLSTLNQIFRYNKKSSVDSFRAEPSFFCFLGDQRRFPLCRNPSLVFDAGDHSSKIVAGNLFFFLGEKLFASMSLHGASDSAFVVNLLRHCPILGAKADRDHVSSRVRFVVGRRYWNFKSYSTGRTLSDIPSLSRKKFPDTYEDNKNVAIRNSLQIPCLESMSS